MLNKSYEMIKENDVYNENNQSNKIQDNEPMTCCMLCFDFF
jgi:hypothetical protein